MSDVFGWLCLVLVLLSVGIVSGIFIDRQLTDDRLQALDRKEAKLRAEWNALHAAQRLNTAFMESRRLMWEEAVRAHPRPRP